MNRPTLFVAAVGLALGTTIARGLTARAQEASTLRVGGQVLREGGGPLPGARIRTDALRGPLAAPFGAQREFTTKTNDSGEWSLLGLTRGLWILEVSAADYLPHMIVVPIAMMLRPEPAPWETSLALLPVVAIAPPGTPKTAPEWALIEAADQLFAGDKRAARRSLQRLQGASVHGGSLAAAGDIALLLREADMARRFFELAATAEPKWYRPQLGLASAAMLKFDVDRAVKAYAAARDTTDNRKLQLMLSLAIKDLQQIRDIGRVAPF